MIARLPYRSLNGGQSDDSLCKATLDNETNVKVQYLLPTKFELHNILALIISQQTLLKFEKATFGKSNIFVP